MFLHIFSSYAKILGKTNFHTWEFPRSGSKAKDGEREKERKRERPKVGNNNGLLRIETPPRMAHAKPPGPINEAIPEHDIKTNNPATTWTTM